MSKSHEQTIREALKEFSEQKKFKQKLSLKKLETIWIESFGSLAGAYMEKITFHKGILCIHTSSSSLRKELLINKKLILQQLNKQLTEDEKLEDIDFR